MTKAENGFYISADDDSGFFLSDAYNKNGFVPKIGDAVELFEHRGAMIRGMNFYNLPADELNNEPQKLFGYYKTDEDIEKEDQKRKIQYEKERQERFAKNKERMDKEYEALPAVFRARIDRLRKGNPNFRMDFEEYEVVALKQAIEIANKLQSKEDILKFMELPYEQQEKICKMEDGLSGNQFGFAVKIALWWISNPKNVIIEHGAMAPLTGDAEYEGSEFRSSITDTLYDEYKDAFPDFMKK